MAVLRYFIMCDSISEVGGKLSFHGVFDMINAVNFPGNHEKCTIVMSWIDGIGKYKLDMEVIASNNDVIFNNNLEFDLNSQTQGANIIIQLEGLPLPTPGIYWIIIKLNGAEVSRYPLTVNQLEVKSDATRMEMKSILREQGVKDFGIEIKCPSCNINSQLFVMDDVKTNKPNFYPFPDVNDFICPHCKEFTFNLLPIRKQLWYNLKNTNEKT
ncbi:MAG TPA: hypothetical protein VFC84_20665 [Desulfosporosinus sp.]|nr:hypothetical protein [Desulfosporosinus sp.]